jgi:hypothetical protein
MHKKILFITILLFSIIEVEGQQSDTVSKYTADYMERVYGFIEDENYEKAQKELDIALDKYFRNEGTYERALFNQLYGQFHALQSQFMDAVPYYEAALFNGGIAKKNQFEVRFQLAQTYFMVARYEDVVPVLLEFITLSERYAYPLPAQIHLLLAYSYGRQDLYAEAYKQIDIANNKSSKPQKEWLEYQFALGMKIAKYEEIEDVALRLLYLDPYKKKYWDQISGLYYLDEKEVKSLSSIELAYENNTLKKKEDFLMLSKYYLYQKAPIKSVEVLEYALDKNIIIDNEENLKLLSSAYFYSRDIAKGIDILKKAEKLSDDADLSFRLGTYAFDNDDYKLAIKSFKNATEKGWSKIPGRIELLLGISYFELKDYDNANIMLKKAEQFPDSKDIASGWLGYVAQFQS